MPQTADDSPGSLFHGAQLFYAGSANTDVTAILLPGEGVITASELEDVCHAGRSRGMVALYRTVGGIAVAIVGWIFFVVVFVVLG